MPGPVTDPDLLRQLNTEESKPGPVVDPEILAQLNGQAPRESFLTRELVGPIEGLAHAASGLVSYPVGLARAAATYLDPADRAKHHSEVLGGSPYAYGSGNPDDRQAWERAGQERRDLADRWTYTPRTHSGQVSAGQWDNNMVTRGLQKAGELAGKGGAWLNRQLGGTPQQQQMASDIVGEAAPLVAAELGVRGLKGARTAVLNADKGLSRYAERAAVKSTVADRTATRRAFRGDAEALQDQGRWMLDKDLPLETPQGIKKAALGIGDVAGKQIGDTLTAVDASGATVDLQAAVNAAKNARAVARLAKNKMTRGIYTQIADTLDDWVNQHGQKVKPSVAHDIRTQIDELADWDKATPKGVQRAWRSARAAVDDQLGRTMDAAGVGDQWSQANQDFGNARRLANPKTHRGLADIGAERRSANEGLTLPEKIAGATTIASGLGAGVATGHVWPAVASGLLAAGEVGVNRRWWPYTARAADVMSRGISAIPPVPAPVSSIAGPATEAAALSSALRRWGAPSAPNSLPFGWNAAAADEREP